VGNPSITYRAREDATAETERALLGAAYAYLLMKRKNVEPPRARQPRRRVGVKAWLIHGGGVLRGGGTGVGADVPMRGGDHVETSPVSTDQRAQEDQ